MTDRKKPVVTTEGTITVWPDARISVADFAIEGGGTTPLLRHCARRLEKAAKELRHEATLRDTV